MTQKEILEYNNRCAKFLGVDVDYSTEVYKDSKSPLRDHINNKPKSEPLLFDEDWNWIMRVVVAIEKLGFNFDSYTPIGIGKDGFYEFNIWNRINPEIEGRGNTSIEAYIDAINQFLIWHEQNK